MKTFECFKNQRNDSQNNCPQIGVSRDNGDIGLTELPGLTAKTGEKRWNSNFEYIKNHETLKIFKKSVRKEPSIMPYFLTGLITALAACVIVETYLKNDHQKQTV